MSSFKRRTVNALAWSFISKALSQVISIAIGIVLARLLVPSDFGLIAMTLVVLGFAGLLADVGLGSALIQNIKVKDEHFCSVFWANNLVGLMLAVFVFFLSPKVANFYNHSEIELISKVLSITFLIGALAMVPRTYLNKKLAVKELVIADSIGMILGSAVAITMALNDFGYWSLVAQRLVDQITSTFIVWKVSSWRPKLIFSLGAIRELLSFSINVFFTGSLQYISANIGNLVLGKYFSAQNVGLFDKAHTMMLFPILNISHVIAGVMFPSLSMIQDDKARVRGAYLRIISAISLVTFPMLVGMFVVSGSFVNGVLGSHWVDVIPLFKILCIAGIASSVATVTGSLYISQGKAKLQLNVNLITQPIRIICILIGVRWGLIGVVVAFTIGHIIAAMITMHVGGGIIGLSLLQIFKNLLPAFVMSIIMGAVVGMSDVMFDKSSHIATFVGESIIGMLVYMVLVIIIKPRSYTDIVTTIVEAFEKKRISV